MLQRTFQHIPGIGSKTEERLWNVGIHTWDVCETIPAAMLRGKKSEILKRCLEESVLHVRRDNPNYFSSLLRPAFHWRMFPEFRHCTAYLDIETTGLDPSGNSITTIALYDGDDIRTYVNGINLDKFRKDISKYKLIITFNGKTFDVPFIERFLRLRLGHAHVDLRYVMSALGFRGGLKQCEIQLEMDRGDTRGIDGYFAVLLWEEYKKNKNRSALETLLAYNIQDVLSLEKLMVCAYNLNLENTPFSPALRLPKPSQPSARHRVDMATVKRIMPGFGSDR